MAEDRPPIPDPIKREVRQRCGFGCVICGLPLYEYEHILGYATVKRHVASEITLLCDRHHREKTGGLLPPDMVLRANEEPYNLRSGVSKPYDLHFSPGESCTVMLGGNTFTALAGTQPTVLIPLMVDGVPLVVVEMTEGHLLLTLHLFDEYNRPILRVIRNELTYRPIPWDIELVGRNLIIRQASQQILVDIEFEVPHRLVVKRGRFLFNGVELLLGEEYAVISDGDSYGGWLGCSCEVGPGQCGVGLMLGPGPTGLGAGFARELVSRYSGRARPRLSAWLNQNFPMGP